MPKPELDRLRHNYQRMKILQTLKEYKGVGRKVAFDELRQAVAIFGVPLVPKQLDFHLRVMQEEGWVRLQIGADEESADAILNVELTARGLDRLDLGTMPELRG